MRQDPLFVAKATMLGGILLGVVFVALNVFGLLLPSSSAIGILSLALAGVFVFSGFS
ncbi:MAG: hypothetical protein R2826_11650 [Thermoleophilia bacterium]